MLFKNGVTSLSMVLMMLKKIIERKDGIIETDYIIRQSAERNIYMLHPTLFKKILIRSRNTDKYADYYLLLEKCIKHYSDYQISRHINTIQENNKLTLKTKQTLDRFVIVYDQNR